MKSASAVAIVLAGVTLATTPADARAAGNAWGRCTARVVYSEELPFAPIDSWLVNVTLEITPQHGVPFYAAWHERMPWQRPPPRRGQAFHVWCDPSNPNNLRLARQTSPSF